MNEYDPLEGLLTPQMQRDVQGSGTPRCGSTSGPTSGTTPTWPRCSGTTQCPGFRASRRLPASCAAQHDFALVIVPPRAELAARIRGDVDRLRRKLAEMSMPQVDAKTGLCHAFADESVFTNCLVIRGRYTLDLRETFAEIENGNGNIPDVFLEPTLRAWTRRNSAYWTSSCASAYRASSAACASITRKLVYARATRC